MTQFELHSLLASNRELIANTWNFFLFVHLGVLASVGVRRNLDWRVFIAAPFYIGFLYLNYRAQVDNYAYSNAILTALSALEHGDGALRQVATTVFHASWVVSYLGAIYVGTATVTVLIVLIATLAAMRKNARA